MLTCHCSEMDGVSRRKNGQRQQIRWEGRGLSPRYRFRQEVDSVVNLADGSVSGARRWSSQLSTLIWTTIHLGLS